MDRLTDLSTIRALCAKYGFSLSKGFGQHFLTNAGICPKICEAAGIGPGSRVLEIGPGFGTLTRELAARAEKVAAIEVDRRLLPVLEETLAGCHNVTVIHQDVMKADLAAIINEQLGGTATVCANLPYNLTSPILMLLLESGLPIDSITVMVQQEAARRLTAAPGTREAGAITYAAHYYARPSYHFTVNPGSFHPPPKVKSAVIGLQLLGSPPAPELFRLVRAAFGQRRKTLLNAASAGLGVEKPRLAAAMAAAGIPPMARPEQLSLEAYQALAAALGQP